MPLVGVCAFNLFEFISHILSCMYVSFYLSVCLLNAIIEKIGLQLDPPVIFGCSLQQYFMV